MTNHIIRFSFLLLFTALLRPGYSQSSDYKDLLEARPSMSREAYLFSLIDFQAKYPEWPNVYYKLGMLQLEILSEFDPLVDRTASRQFLYNAKINFGLAKNYLDEKEARKNYEWYDVQDVKDKDSLIATVIGHVDIKYTELSTYLNNYEKLIHHYDLAVSNYLQAREAFIDINTRAENLRALFLTANDDLKEEIRMVGVNFDSTLYHLEHYKEIYQKMPYSKKREANVTLQTIDYYRMNGITPSNFLADNLLLWNYKSWSENFITLIEQEVDGLKSELSEAYETFTSINTRMLNGNECIQVDVDDMKLQRLVNLVSKYDNQSLLIDLYQYLMAKLKYSNQLVYETNCNLSDAQPTDHLLSRKARIYQTIYSYLDNADSLNSRMLSSGHGKASFQWFFDKYLPGNDGSQMFVNAQGEENRRTFLAGLTEIKKLQQQQYLLHDTSTYTLAVKSDTLFTVFDSSATARIKLVKSLPVDSIYSILLIQKKADLHSIVGARKISTGYKVFWEEFLEKGQQPVFFKVLTDSSFAISGTGAKPWLKHIDLFGSKKANFSIPSKASVKNLFYNNLLENYTLVQESGYDTLSQKGSYLLNEINKSGKSSRELKLDLPGKFITMINQDTTIWFFSHSLDLGASKITASVMHKDTKEWLRQYSYQYTAELVDPIVIKNDNEFMTVLGRKPKDVSLLADLPTGSPAGYNQGLIYSIIDYEGVIRNETEL